MDDNLEQLLKSLRPRPILEILDNELQRAEKTESSYAAFLTDLLRHEYQSQPERFLNLLIVTRGYG